MWQRYASITAAACAKELLSYVPPADIAHPDEATDLGSSTHLYTERMGLQVQNIRDDKVGKFLMNDSDESYTKHKNRKSEQVKDTHTWFTNRDK